MPFGIGDDERITSTTTDAGSPCRILVVDDHPIVLRGIVQIIDNEVGLEVCATAQGADEAFEQARDTNPDLAVVDIDLRAGSGIELVKSFRQMKPEMPVLLLSMHEEEIYAERGLRAGARGYIMKREAVSKIILAIRTILGGEIYLSKRMVSRLLQQYVTGRPSKDEGPYSNLTDRELEVFRLMGHGESVRQIAIRLCLSIKTVETYQSRLKSKLMLESNTVLSQHAIMWVTRDKSNL
jgi:DNA-binding NarL/FixJ family response regulator